MFFTYTKVETLETALAAERQKNSDERMALSRSHNEITRLKKEIQDLKDRTERESHNDQYYQVKVSDLTYITTKVFSLTYATPDTVQQ